MNAWPPFVDQAFSARLEAAGASQVEGVARLVAEKLPARGAAAIQIAGGWAAFLLPNISLSRAAGLGMKGPVTRQEVETLEHFYRSRESMARILVSPYADLSLIEHLGERGFRVADFNSTVARLTKDPVAKPALDVRRIELSGAADWVRVSLEAFAAPHPATLDTLDIFTAAFAWDKASYFSAYIDGAAAGGGAMHVLDGVAHLFAGSTLPAYRGRGVQTALIRARLAYARELGCDLVFSEAEPGSGSQRNLEREGFVSVYTQSVMIKPLAAMRA
jgi:GNAT superfamily N-acetyltransferase